MLTLESDWRLTNRQRLQSAFQACRQREWRQTHNPGIRAMSGTSQKVDSMDVKAAVSIVALMAVAAQARGGADAGTKSDHLYGDRHRFRDGVLSPGRRSRYGSV